MATVKGVARLLVGAGAAKPSPAIGQSLGPLGVNMMEFCKAFNARTQDFKADTPVPVVLTAFNDRTFEFKIKTPPTSWFVKKVSGIEKGSGKAGSLAIGKISVKQVYEIAKMKHQDDNLAGLPLESVCKSVIATCKSMGVSVVNE